MSSLTLLIQAGHPLLLIETTDEERGVEAVRAACNSLQRQLCDWSMTRGLRLMKPDGTVRTQLVPPGKPAAALEHVLHSGEQAVYLLRDLGPHVKDPQVHRLVRDIGPMCRDRRTTLICLEYLPFPAEASRLVVRYELGWPTTEEVEQAVRDTYQRIRDESLYEVTSRLTRREMDQVVQTLRGLTRSEVERVVASAIYRDYSFSGQDLPALVEAKRHLLGSSGCLEGVAADVSSDDLGGLDSLKRWLQLRRGGFTPAARDFGLQPPRGILMLGVPGCGKSLCAKVVAADWRMPLLRLDPGVLYQKYIGESEQRLREALLQAEAMSPAVLWIDEIEKAFASASADSSDGGLSQRMFGTLLSWMQEHRHPIFLIATANNVEQLPPELMRKGRFDELFFVDLPSAAAREQIWTVHLKRRGRPLEPFDIAELANASEGMSGAEIEQVIRDAMFEVFAQSRELNQADLLSATAATRPLITVMPERIQRLRQWAATRCMPAD
jgi:AAA+ superfamily predicted ATPase